MLLRDITVFDNKCFYTVLLDAQNASTPRLMTYPGQQTRHRAHCTLTLLRFRARNVRNAQNTRAPALTHEVPRQRLRKAPQDSTLLVWATGVAQMKVARLRCHAAPLERWDESRYHLVSRGR